MAKTVDYFLSVYSPWTYFGDARLHEIADRHGANINYKPMQLSRVFPATGGLPLAKRAPQRQDYRLAELARWQKRLGLTINTHPKHFPTDERTASAMAVAATLKGVDPGDFINSLLAAVWVWELDIGDEGTLVRIANDSNTMVFLSELVDKHILRVISILIFIDENMTEPLSVFFQNFWNRQKQLCCLGN